MIKLGSLWKLKEVIAEHLDEFSEIGSKPHEFYVLEVNEDKSLVRVWYPGEASCYILTTEELEIYYKSIDKSLLPCTIRGIIIGNETFALSLNYGLVEVKNYEQLEWN